MARWLVIAAIVTAQSAARQPPVAIEPIGAILDAFRTHPVVGLSAGESHGDLRGPDFVVSLIRDPRFAPTSIDVVIENANARYQDVMDRYIRGEDVPYAELRHVWDDTTQPEVLHAPGDIPIIYRALRDVNRSLPRERVHRALLGDPPIEWEHVESQAEFRKWLTLRDSNPADVIRRESVAKGRKALAVYGFGHLQRKQQATNYVMDSPLAQTLISLLERDRVGTFVVETTAERPEFRAWPVPSLALVRGTTIGAEDVPPIIPQRVAVRPDGAFVPLPKAQWVRLSTEDQIDAVLYLEPESTKRSTEIARSVCSDRAYVEEHLKRMELLRMPAPALERIRKLCEPPR